MSQGQIQTFFSVKKKPAGPAAKKTLVTEDPEVEASAGAAEVASSSSAGLKRKLERLKTGSSQEKAKNLTAQIKDLSQMKDVDVRSSSSSSSKKETSSSSPCPKRAKLSSVNARLLEAIKQNEANKAKSNKAKANDNAGAGSSSSSFKDVFKSPNKTAAVAAAVPDSPQLSRSSFVLDLEVSPAKKMTVPASPTKPKACTIHTICLLYTSPSPRDRQKSRMPSSA